MPQLIRRVAETSVAVRTIRRLGRDSVLCAAIAAVMRPSLAYLGGSRPAESDEESRAAVERVWAVVLDSTPGRLGWRGVCAVSEAWRHSATARAWWSIRDLEAHRQVRLFGGIVLLATLVAGVTRAASREPWPGLSILLWAVVVVGAGVLAVAPRRVSAAWKDHRASR